MDNRQAKEILLRHRPGRADDSSDPELAEALAQARRDPELARWLEDHLTFQQTVSDRLRQLPVPGGLKQKILEGYPPPPAAIVIPWRQPVLYGLAAAAAIVLMIGLVYFRADRAEDRSFAGFRNRVVRNAQRGYAMDIATTNLTEIRSYLAANRAPADYVVPARLEQLPGDGGAVLHWNNKTVSMVCYRFNSREDLYLFVASRSDIPGAPQDSSPEFTRIGRLTTASWSAGDRAYVLAGPGDESFLRRYLP